MPPVTAFAYGPVSQCGHFAFEPSNGSRSSNKFAYLGISFDTIEE